MSREKRTRNEMNVARKARSAEWVLPNIREDMKPKEDIDEVFADVGLVEILFNAREPKTTLFPEVGEGSKE